MDNFAIGYENPTWLLHEGEDVKGTLSLICDDYYLKGQRARVRIFHCETEEEDHYRSLLKGGMAILRDGKKRVDIVRVSKEERGIFSFIGPLP